jgi:hypothetical protein
MFGFLPRPAACLGVGASVYQSHFCGLSCILAKDYGPWARCLINRDSTALALLGTALQSTEPRRCLSTCCNPLASPRALVHDSAVLHYAGAVTVAALATKLDDDTRDERGLRRTLAGLASRALDEGVATARGILHAHAFPVAQVSAALQTPGGDFQDTGRAFGEIFGHLGVVTRSGPSAREALTDIGHALGVLIHAKDAWDDWESDRRHGRPNPLQAFATVESRRNALAPGVATELDRLEISVSRLPMVRHQSLVQAILVDGARGRVTEWMATPGESKRKRRDRKSKGRRCRDHCDPCSGCGGPDCGPCPRCGPSTCDVNPCDGDGCGCDCGGCDCNC